MSGVTSLFTSGYEVVGVVDLSPPLDAGLYRLVIEGADVAEFVRELVALFAL
jgi:hypothetical protein